MRILWNGKIYFKKTDQKLFLINYNIFFKVFYTNAISIAEEFTNKLRNIIKIALHFKAISIKKAEKGR